MGKYHWSSGITVCFLPRGVAVRVPEMHLHLQCIRVFLVAMSRYSLRVNNSGSGYIISTEHILFKVSGHPAGVDGEGGDAFLPFPDWPPVHIPCQTACQR
jgi:hypothetical protein